MQRPGPVPAAEPADRVLASSAAQSALLSPAYSALLSPAYSASLSRAYPASLSCAYSASLKVILLTHLVLWTPGAAGMITRAG